MALQISDIEKRLQSLIEIHLTKYLPGLTYQDRIAQRLSEVLHTSLAVQGTSKAPNEFALVVHPSTLDQWNKEPLLIDGLARIFRVMTEELDIQSEVPAKLTIITDPLVEINDLQVRILKDINLSETQDAKDSGNQADESPPTKPAFLIVGGTKVFTIETAVTNIGRRLDNHLVVNDPRVSRYHAQIRCSRGRFIIFDLNSTGGTFVNGQRASQSVLYPGDVISLAGLPIIFGQDNPPTNLAAGSTLPLTPITSERHTAILREIPGKEKPKQ
jgi:pSer/pThr/pTyr-binding forkhead associated (FHA) protein